MPGFLTDYSNNKVLDLFFGSTIYAPPATLYMGLSLSSASKAGSIIEPVGGGYARVSVANSLANFPAASSGTKSNAAALLFPAPTADWGTVVSVFLADAATGGNVLASADLSTPRSVTNGSPAPKVAAGALFLSHT
jgi:hypothetical protein